MDTPITHDLEKIDPETAAVMLANNNSNRHISASAVQAMAKDMQAGLWAYDGAPIRISDEGALLDGQHRLTAIVKSGMPQEMLVIRGLPRETMLVMDHGRARRSGDFWVMRGHSRGLVFAAAARTYICYTTLPRGTAWDSKNAPSKAAVNSFLAQRENDLLVIKDFIPWNSPCNRSTLLALALLVHEKSVAPDRWESFANVLDTGLGLSERDPAVVLRNYAIRGHANLPQGGCLSSQARLTVYLKAWNRHAHAETMSLARWTRGETMPDVH